MAGTATSESEENPISMFMFCGDNEPEPGETPISMFMFENKARTSSAHGKHKAKVTPVTRKPKAKVPPITEKHETKVAPVTEKHEAKVAPVTGKDGNPYYTEHLDKRAQEFARQKYRFKNTRLNIFGSYIEEGVKNADKKSYAANTHGLDQDCGVKAWRVVNYKLVPWIEGEYGYYYEDDVYIVLSARYRDLTSDALTYDLHLWVGKYANEDDYSAGLLRLMRIDCDQFHCKARQHREIQGNESELFKSYFNPITHWRGSADKRYRNQRKGNYPPRLLRFMFPDRSKNTMCVKEVSADRRYLSDPLGIFFLDCGKQVYHWYGEEVVQRDLTKAITYVQTLKANRGVRPTVDTMRRGQKNTTEEEFFFSNLHKKTDTMKDDDKDDFTEYVGQGPFLMSIEEDSNNPQFTRIKEGTIYLLDLEKEDFCLLDSSSHCFIWIGVSNEIGLFEAKQVALQYAHAYLRTSRTPYVPITVLTRGQGSAALERVLSG